MTDADKIIYSVGAGSLIGAGLVLHYHWDVGTFYDAELWRVVGCHYSNTCLSTY